MGDVTGSSGSGSGSDTDSEKEMEEANKFIQEETMNLIGECINTRLPSQAKLDSLLTPPPSSTPARGSQRQSVTPVPCSPGLGLKETVEEYLAPTVKNGEYVENSDKEENDELDLTGIDDEEIDSYLMSPDEIENKTNLWMMVNAEYLKEQEEKIKREKEHREELIKQGIDPDKKKKTYKKKNKAYLQTNGTALEAIEKIVQEKKLSSKINYDVLKNLTMGLNSMKKSEDDTDGKTEATESVMESSSVVSVKRGPSPSLENSEATVSSIINKRARVTPARKTSSSSIASPQKDVVPKSDPDQRSLYDTEPIIESGPVVQADPADNDEDEISDFSDEDEPMKSAAELLSQQFGVENGYGEEEEYY